MSTRLVPLSDRRAPVIALQRPVVLIGRHPECDVRIDRPQISRRHCCLALADDRLVIRDLGSSNGTRVNGLPIGEARLQPGDEVAIAQIIYRLEGPVVQPASPARPHPEAARPESLPDLPPIDIGDPDVDLVPLTDKFRPVR